MIIYYALILAGGLLAVGLEWLCDLAKDYTVSQRHLAERRAHNNRMVG